MEMTTTMAFIALIVFFLMVTLPILLVNRDLNKANIMLRMMLNEMNKERFMFNRSGDIVDTERKKK